MVPWWYKSTQARAPQSNMLAARTPSIRASNRCAGSMASNSCSRSGKTASAAAFSLSLSSLHCSQVSSLHSSSLVRNACMCNLLALISYSLTAWHCVGHKVLERRKHLPDCIRIRIRILEGSEDLSTICNVWLRITYFDADEF